MSARRYRVLFDPDAIAEDLAHATAAAREIGQHAVTRLQRDGITREQLRGCNAEGHDGTRLPGCVKTYLPQPDGAAEWCSSSAPTITARSCSASRSASGTQHATPGARASTRSPTAAYTTHTPEPTVSGRR